jgi:hypothetical protein
MKIKESMRKVAVLFTILIINILFSCNSTGQRTRSFKLTQDSTFIGAWGGELQDEQTGYFPKMTKSFNLMFIYSKENKLYVMYQPRYFNTDSTRELQCLENTLTANHWYEISQAFDTSFVLESETVIAKKYKYDSWYKYQIDEYNNLIYYYYTKTLSGDGRINYFTFKPYYFKTIKNPGDKN